MPVRTIARPKVRTIDEAIVLMTEKMAESSVHFEKKIAESSAHFEKKVAESRAYFEKKIAESDAKRAESDAQIAASQAKTDLVIQRMAETVEKLSKKVDKVTAELSGIGTLGNRFGTLIELIVTPGIRKEINEHGHNFKYATANKLFRYQKKDIAEVDLFLSNGAETMAVEIKAGLTLNDVKNHIKQLKTLRKYEVEINIQNKKLYGAMVGLSIDNNAREHALKNGIYILKILEQEEKLKTEKPTKARVW